MMSPKQYETYVHGSLSTAPNHHLTPQYSARDAEASRSVAT